MDAILREHRREIGGRTGEMWPFIYLFFWVGGKTLKEVKPGLFLASNQILKECQEKQQLIKDAKCSSHYSAADVGVFTPDESTSH